MKPFHITMSTETIPTSSPQLHGSQPFLNDCLIQVRDSEDTKTALFWLRSYLSDPADLHENIEIDARKLSYSKFEADLTAHFGYDSSRDEIAWESKNYHTRPHPRAHRDSFSRSLTEDYSVVYDFDSWVNAVHTMGQPSLVSITASDACPVKTMAYFTVVRCKWIYLSRWKWFKYMAANHRFIYRCERSGLRLQLRLRP
jgi:hypothetical protein